MTIRILHPLFSLLASVTRQELALQVAYLMAENELLRARLPKHIVTTTKDHLPPACEQTPKSVKTLKSSEVVCTTRLGGHLKAYARREA